MELADTRFATLYYHELWWLSNSIVKKCDQIFEDAAVPESGYMIQFRPDIHSLISSLLSDAANIKKLVITPSVKLSGENGERFKLRKERANALFSLIGSLEIVELLNFKVRNTLEHFDEYLDEANYEVSKSAPEDRLAAYNLIISHWEVIKPRVYPIRLYVSNERKFYNMKWSVDIGKIYIEAKSIVEKLNAAPEIQGHGPGGLMLWI